MRRLLWLTVGAGLGISGYRRANRIVRDVTRGRPATRQGRRAEGLARFARDVREGMDLYAEQQRLNIERRRAPGGHTLGSHQVIAASAASATSATSATNAASAGHRAGRNGSAAPRAHH
jgi:hypothetical protein